MRILIPLEKNYEDIKTIQQMGLEYDEKYLFQTDLELTTSKILWTIKSNQSNESLAF
jgi:hypothetical protein